MSSKRYPDEIKIEAIKQVVELGYPVAQVAKRLGKRPGSLSGKYWPEVPIALLR